MLVGPNLAISYSSRSVPSGTGLSSQPLCVRASRNSWRRPLWSIPRDRPGIASMDCIASPQYKLQRSLLASSADEAVTSISSRRGTWRSEDDGLGARRYEIDGIRRPLLAPHLVGDFANDLAVLHFEKMGQTHGKLGANGIGNVGHLV